MANVRPFKGLRYDPRRVDLNAVVAPPRGEIDDRLEKALFDRDPRNVVRVICDTTPNRHRSDYLIADWLRAGILRSEPVPALYLLRETWEDAQGTHSRQGFFAAVSPIPPTGSGITGRILPHERTVPGRGIAPRGIREPIFLLYQDPSGRVQRTMAAESAERIPDIACEVGGVKFELFIIEDETACARVTAELAEGDLLIADGHHRFESLLAQAEGSPEPPTFMAFLSSCEDPGNRLTAIHRVVDSPGFNRDNFVARCARFFEVRSFYDEESVHTAFRAAQGHAFVLLHGEDRLLFSLRKDAPLESVSGLPIEGPLRRIEAPLLDALVVRRLLEVEGSSRIRYLFAQADVEAAVAADPNALGILLPHPRINDVLEAARADHLLPEKTTCFSPKVPNGLVLPP